jgi:hypothetical protein
MDVGMKLWVFLLGGVAIVGAVWLLWSRFIGFPQHDPTASRPPDGDSGAGATDMSSHRHDAHHS